MCSFSIVSLLLSQGLSHPSLLLSVHRSSYRSSIFIASLWPDSSCSVLFVGFVSFSSRASGAVICLGSGLGPLGSLPTQEIWTNGDDGRIQRIKKVQKYPFTEF